METSIREAKIELINIAIKITLPAEAVWSVLRRAPVEILWRQDNRGNEGWGAS
jgi:hypothetical protein